MPERGFRSEFAVDLGNRPVQIMHVGGDHAGDSCIVVVPGVVAFLSDCVYPCIHEEPNYFTRRRLFPILDRLLALDVKHYVLGHRDHPMSRVEFESLAGDMRTAGDLVREHLHEDRAIPDRATASIAEFVQLFNAGARYQDE